MLSKLITTAEALIDVVPHAHPLLATELGLIEAYFSALDVVICAGPFKHGI